MQKILINGYFLCRKLTGIERYAFEITSRLDRLCRPDEIAIIIPADAVNIPKYKNILTIRYGKTIQHVFWQMFTLQFFLLSHRHYTILDFGNTILPFAPGIIFLHDIYCEYFPEDFTGFRDKLAGFYNRWQYRLIAQKAKKIVTVSHFSKNQIAQSYHIDPDTILVIYSSWSHFKNIQADYSVFDAFSVLSRPFYFSLGSLSKRKNIRWIIDYASKHRQDIFAISGDDLPTAGIGDLSGTKPSNIILLGYLDDSKIRALMERCKAFLLPSYYEGFGLTPLEALSCGAKCIVANAASLPEIYGNTVHYIDPFDTNVDLDALLQKPVESPEAVLEKYSFDTSAEQVYDLIREMAL
ncbi:MAG: glycosyltransferase family 4 protein [Treponema sp.]|jgi:glycosyltransferase involved in cell wall biosynthesis|nr:glycosyltransferase family 4 protein [Treponema sp.]